MIDLHSHLLPGVDDGAATIDISVEVLGRFYEQGVRTLVCTPHLKASKAQDAPWEHHHALLEELRAVAPPGITLRLGWEIMLDEPGVDLTDDRLRLGGARAVLVEFARGAIPPRSVHELERISAAGVRPVLAHPERYFGCALAHVREWRSVGTVIQTDATYLLGGGAKGTLARAMLEEGLVDLLASDNHGDTRSLAGARQWLLDMGAVVQADLLTNLNASAVLADHRLTPVPPVTFERGMVARLRELLFGGR
ncbi:MAG TPA: CpsB/CapC family capsule biosynthesis tyrosine phosphatase [Gemmatimonadaceae bacterium]|jgi:protein-tyrosine phosphatase|nr:CpsB/CapC family capsule biosynthesis tyrosine phosphatase [Gemmatimonadaceae bacterium]